MQLSAAKKVTFLVSAILIIVALLSFFGVVPLFMGEAHMQHFWFAFAGWAVLAAANALPGL